MVSVLGFHFSFPIQMVPSEQPWYFFVTAVVIGVTDCSDNKRSPVSQIANDSLSMKHYEVEENWKVTMD